MWAGLCAILAISHVDTYFLKWSKPQWTDDAIARLHTIKKSVDMLYGNSRIDEYVPSGTRGVVYTAGPSQYNDLIISIMAIRQHSRIEIEVWLDEYVQDNDSPELSLLRTLDVTLHSFATVQHLNTLPLRTNVGDRKFHMKSRALLYSKFDHILALDADCIPIIPPETLLDMHNKKSMFWPDLWEPSPQNPAWSIFCSSNAKCDNVTVEVESGQMILYKPTAWISLQVAALLLQNNDVYTFLNGDKDTYRLAMFMTDSPFEMATYAPHIAAAQSETNFCGHSLLHFLDNGEPAFIHHSGYKLSYHKYIPGMFAITKPTVGYKVLHDKPQDGIDCINYDSNAKVNSLLQTWEANVFDNENVQAFVRSAVIHLPPGHFATSQTNRTLINVVEEEDDLTTFETIIPLTNIDDKLKSVQTQITVFAPVNSAFDNVKPEILNSLFADTQTLQQVLNYHIYADSAILISDLSDGPNAFTMANGETLVVTVDPTDKNVALFTTNGTLLGKVVDADRSAKNGVAHLIDTLLVPPSIVVEPRFINDDEKFLGSILTGSAFSVSIAVAILIGNEFSALFGSLNLVMAVQSSQTRSTSSLVM